MVKKYVKKSAKIEAIQYTSRNGWYIRDWSNGMVTESPILEPTVDNPTGQYMQIPTSTHPVVKLGDYVIKDSDDIFHSCDKNLFKQKYDSI